MSLAIWARRALGTNWSGEISIKVEHHLIRSGPYQRLRHPIYTGLLAMYVGTALVTGTWLAIVGVVIAGVAYWRKIRLEEKNLDVAFGAEYDAYGAKHGRWFRECFEPAEPWIILDRVISFAPPGLAQIAAARPRLAL